VLTVNIESVCFYLYSSSVILNTHTHRLVKLSHTHNTVKVEN